MDGALRVIRYARESDRPLLGTCAGFQHLVIELARDVLGIADAAHAENDPDAPNLFVSLLSCSLVGQSMTVSLRPGTRAAALYPAASATERYYCRFGLHPARVADLEAAGVVVSGVDQDDEPRIIELPDHRFALATLFVPQTSSAPGAAHPVVAGLRRGGPRTPGRIGRSAVSGNVCAVPRRPESPLAASSSSPHNACALVLRPCQRRFCLDVDQRTFPDTALVDALRFDRLRDRADRWHAGDLLADRDGCSLGCRRFEQLAKCASQRPRRRQRSTPTAWLPAPTRSRLAALANWSAPRGRQRSGTP